MSTILVADLETYYDKTYSLSRITTESYIRNPQFQVIGAAFKPDAKKTKWFAGPAKFVEVINSIDWSDCIVVAQNTAFDGAIMSWLYGVKPKAWVDIMGMSRALFPHEKSHSLKAQAERMGIGQKGTEVENALGKRYSDFSKEELARYGEYCINDVELTYQLFHRYMEMGFPLKELKLMDLTLRMFIDPVLELDSSMLEQHLVEVRANKHKLLNGVRDALLYTATVDEREQVVADGMEGIKKLLMSNDKFAQALQDFGVEPPTKISPTTGKLTWAFAKTDEAFKALEEHDDLHVQALVSARLGAKSTIEETRTETLIDYAKRGTFPIALRYYGAHTGRWSAESSAKVNMQNLPRSSKIKNAIQAPDGYVMCGADLSNIELRLGLWLAGQDDRVKMLADGLDLYKDFSKDVFCIEYDQVTKAQRQVGKVANLSLIYGTGAAKLKDALRIMGGVKMELDEVKPIVQMYRRLYSCVADAWGTGEQALLALAAGHTMTMYKGTCVVEPGRGIRLPNGLHLQFPNLRKVRIKDKKTGEEKEAWAFDSKYGLEVIYGSKVFQGCTQAIARCIMGEGLLRIQKWSPVRLTIHDSAYWLALEGEAEKSLQRGIDCITAPVSYCPGLPLAAEGAWGKSLADC